MSFSEIKGQDQSIRIIKEYVRNSRLTGGYLFSGPEGIGKFLTAITLAKALNCQEKSFDACENCVSCLKIEENNHPDVHRLDNASSAIKIEDIRQLQREASLRPYEADFKIFLINNAHNLTAEASNALLKTLEEPSKNCLIILITSRPMLIFKTIISRCKTIKFFPLSRMRLSEILKEEYHLDGTLSRFLAYFAEGRIAKALQLKDADIFQTKNKVIDEYVYPNRPLFNFVSSSDRQGVHIYLEILTSWFRDLYLIKAGMEEAQVINLDRRLDLLRVIDRYTLFDLEEILETISQTSLFLEENLNIKLLLSNLRTQLWRE